MLAGSLVFELIPGSTFVLYRFEWPPHWWERPSFNNLACEPGEIERRFGPYFHIERYAGATDLRGLPHG